MHKLDSKYLEEVNLVGKFDDIEEYNEIFNDYANNHAQGTYAHIEGKANRIYNSPIAAHIEGAENIASGNYDHVEGFQNKTGSSGEGKHAEGYTTYADYCGAHAEGMYTYANSGGAHSEG